MRMSLITYENLIRDSYIKVMKVVVAKYSIVPLIGDIII